MNAKTFGVAAYHEGLAQRRLVASRCTHCDALYLPPRPICSACQAQDMEWAELRGEGTVIGFTNVAIAPSVMAAKGYGRDTPYVTAIVALKEGPTVAARIEAADAGGAGQDVRVGMPVRADFLKEPDGKDRRHTLVFKPR
jgi:uncharacterized OB-fold protein